MRSRAGLFAGLSFVKRRRSAVADAAGPRARRRSGASSLRRPTLALLGALTVAVGVSLGAATALADTAPTATIEAPTAVSYTSAQLSGAINPNGGPSTTNWFFQYLRKSEKEAGEENWSYANFESFSESQSAESTPLPVTATVEYLTPGTAYLVRLGASNEGGETFSAEREIETEALAAPVVSMKAPDALSGTSAHFEGEIDPGGTDPASDVTWRFECTPECPGLEGGQIEADEAQHTVSAEAKKLQPNTAYEVSLIAENAGGPVAAGPESFMTEAIRPTATTIPAFALEGGTAALLGGKVDPENSPTTYYIEYGPNSSYGQSAPATRDASAGSGNEVTFATQKVSGLSPASTYHFRLVAENAAGATPGEDMSFTTAPASTIPTAEACPNEALRAESAWGVLSDCRGYEQVSPASKTGDVEPSTVANAAPSQSAADGQGVTFPSNAAFASSGSLSVSNSYLADRGPDAWLTQSLAVPVLEHQHLFGVLRSNTLGCSVDLARCVQESPTPLVAGAPEGFFSLYVRNNATGALALATPTTPPNVEAGAVALGLRWTGASANFIRIIFDAKDALTPEAPPPGEAPINLYEYDLAGDQLRLVSVLPDGTVAPGGAVAGGGGGPGDVNGVQGSIRHAMSEDGSRVFFTSPVPGTGNSQIYVRRDHITTDEVSKSARAPEDPHGPRPATFQMATPDGRYVLFTSSAELTDRSNTGDEDQGSDLYRYDVDTEQLVDLTPDDNPGDPFGAEVKRATAISDDGADVYFVAAGALAEGAQAGQANLYLWHEGDVSLVATHERDIIEEEGIAFGEGAERTTPDGGYLAFVSGYRLTAYETQNTTQVYLFDAATGSTVCVSCSSSASASTGSSFLSAGQDTNGHYQPRNLSADGRRLFFESKEPLVRGDTNGAKDVYEWEAAGEGTCVVSGPGFEATSGGCLSLISGGRSSAPSTFADASSTGDDVFFTTRQPLVPGDEDELTDLYDARVGGGFASTAPPGECSGEACRPFEPAPGPGLTPGRFSGAVSTSHRCAAPFSRAAALRKRARALRARASRSGRRTAVRLRRRGRHLTERAAHFQEKGQGCRGRTGGR